MAQKDIQKTQPACARATRRRETNECDWWIDKKRKVTNAHSRTDAAPHATDAAPFTSERFLKFFGVTILSMPDVNIFLVSNFGEWKSFCCVIEMSGENQCVAVDDVVCEKRICVAFVAPSE